MSETTETSATLALRLSNTLANGAHHQEEEAYTLEPSNRQAVAPSLFREHLTGQLFESETAVPLRSGASTNYQFVGPMEAVVVRTTGDYADPTIKVDELPMLAAHPMSDREMAVFQPPVVSTSSAGASRARISRSPGAVQASLPLALDSSSSSSAWLERYALAGFSWKTSLASSAATTGTTSGSSSLPWETQGTAWRGECWTRAGSESPNGGEGCSLSGILEPRVPPRFSLSPKACQGILRRAQKRGRTLPAPLAAALASVAGAATSSG